MEKKSKSITRGQTPVTGVMPKLQKKFDSFPFYYASLQCQWVYWYTTLKAAEPFVDGTGLGVARFPVDTGKSRREDRAVILLNFQRYTAHYDNALGVTNEVEFNLIAYPKNRSPGVPYLPLEEFLHGHDQTKTLGHLRLHVAADSAVAVEAGRAVFGEPKFVGNFNYKVPALNAKRFDKSGKDVSHCWRIELIDPDNKDDFVYRLDSDFAGFPWEQTNCTPIPEFATGLGRTVWTHWTIVGIFNTCMLDQDKARQRKVKLEIGNNDFSMTRDMRALFTDKAPAAVQTFDSPPACIEPRGFYVDAIDRDDRYG